jgi:hypothetical protein
MEQDLYLGLERCPEEIGVKLAGWREQEASSGRETGNVSPWRHNL